MIIRLLRPDETEKLNMLQSSAYGFPMDAHKLENIPFDIMGAFLDDDHTLVASVYIREFQNVICGHYYPMLGIAGVATHPAYRRLGATRAIMDKIFNMAPKKGWITSFLHPFSYDYYRKYGYERLYQTQTIQLPAAALSRCPKNTDVRQFSYEHPEVLKDILSVYHQFAKAHNGMMYRDEKNDAWSDVTFQRMEAYSSDPYRTTRHTYVHYSSQNEPDALATFLIMGEILQVDELSYVNAKGLRGILGFLRTFDIQVKEFRFRDLPRSCAIDLILGEYVDVSYSLHSAAMGRILLVEDFLKINRYPTEAGHFRLRCEDTLPYNRAVFEVQYGNGSCQIQRLPYEADFDISAPIPALSRLMLCGGFTAEKAEYLDSVTFNGSSEDFFRAFPDRDLHLQDFF